MAEDTDAKEPKGKKGSFLKKKIAGIPAPVVLVVGGIAVYYLYTKYKGSSSSSTTGASTTGTATAPDASGTGSSGYTDTGSGGGYSGSGYTDPNATSSPGTATSTPTDTSSLTPAPVSAMNSSRVTPIGKKTISVGGKSFNTVSGFTQNGATYLGINNPAEAKQLEAQGVSLVHNPNDPTTSSLFVLIPKGKSGPVIKKPPAKPKPKAKAKA